MVYAPPPFYTIHKNLYDSLLNGTALAVSDGSFFPSEMVGTCAWVLASPDGCEYIAGGGIIPGTADDQGSYRSELGGQAGIANVVSNLVLSPPQGTQRRHITTVCDGLSALETARKQNELIKVKHKHADLISITSSLWESSNFRVTRLHIKAHQDDLHRPLTVNETLNCQMDTLAKDIAIRHIRNKSTRTFHTTTLGFGTVSCARVMVTSKFQQSLYYFILRINTISRLSVLLKCLSTCFVMR